MDLAALAAAFRGATGPLVLEASDTTLPTELTAFLGTVPGTGVTLTPGSGGVSLQGSTLRVAGTCTDGWSVQGLSDTTMTLTDLMITIDASSTTPEITASGHATLPLGAPTASAVTFASTDRGGWAIGLAEDVHGVTPGALIAMVLAEAQPLAVPAQLGLLAQSLVLERDGFELSFFPNTALDALLAFTIADPSAKFTLVAGVAELDGVTLTASVMTHSIAMVLTGDLSIGAQPVDVSVGLSTDAVMTASIAAPAGKTIPSIEEIAGWIAGTAPSHADAIGSGFQSVGFDTTAFDAAISGVSVTFDAADQKLISLAADSTLTVAGLPLDVRLTLPDLTVSGSLRPGATVTVSEVVGSIGLPTADLPVDSAITDVRFAASPGRGSYMAELGVGGVAKLGTFALDAISLLVTYSDKAFDGQFNARMTLWDLGELDAAAEYSSTAGWTWSVATSAGGDLAIGHVLTHLEQDFGLPQADVPGPIQTLTLTGLAMSYAGTGGTFTFTCTGTFQVYDTPVEICPTIEVKPVDPTDAAKGYDHTFGGAITLAGIELQLGYDTTPTSTTFVASFLAGDGGPGAIRPAAVDLARLVAAVSPALAAETPSGLSIDLKSAKLASVSRDGGARTLALALDLSASVALSELPLIGDKLPAGATVAIEDLQVSYASPQLDGDGAKALNALLQHVTPFPESGVGPGAAVTATVDLAGSTEVLSLGLAPPGGSPPSQQGQPGLIAASTAGEPTDAAPTEAAPTARWFDVQKQLGVVQFQRVGAIYQDGDLFFAIDASVTLGPLKLSVQGLGVGSPLTTFDPTFTFTGLGIAYSAPPLEIAGAVLRAEPPPPNTRFELDGTVTVKTTGLSLAAVASYAALEDGSPSLFAFVQLEKALGGPPAFFVTGLMGGFGFNRSLTLPAQDEVLGFPLLLLNQPAAPGDEKPKQQPSFVLDVMEGRKPPKDGGTKRAWIAPEAGTSWLAVGVEFTSFELVTTRAVLIAEFGHELEFALLGLSVLKLPQTGDNDNPYAYAELELEAVLKPADGAFGLTAILSPNSYVLTPACKLTGGFAFDAWFGSNPNAGQFVVTLGGYHPAFTPPASFPQVPRLGFNWAVSDDVSISGDAYFALTTSAVMAGGRLSAQYHSGDLSAWFDASADVLVSWRPFFFTAEITVDIGVSYRLNLLFCHKTISLSLGASVELWGPPTGGAVHVHLWCVSFTVSFGSDGAGTAKDPLTWDEFAGLLPAGDQVVRLLPVSGMYKTMDDDTNSSSGRCWVVRATSFSFTTRSAVPATHLCYGEPVPGSPPAGVRHASTDLLDVKPMNVQGATAVHWLAVRRDSPTAELEDVTCWTLSPSTQNTPDSLWGTPPSPFTQSPALPEARVVPDQFVGFSVTPPPPALGGTRGVFPISELGQECLGITAMPLAGGETPSTDYRPQAGPDSIGDIGAIDEAATARTSIREALADAGLYTGPDEPLTAFATRARTLFVDAPMEQASPL